jgi:hypothetical protein
MDKISSLYMILTILTLCYLGKTNPPKARRSLIDPTTSSLANWPRNMPQEYQHIESEIDYKSTIQYFIIFFAEFFLLTNYTNCIVIQYNIDSTLMLYHNLANYWQSSCTTQSGLQNIITKFGMKHTRSPGQS